jgi:hypothetical protein
MFVLDNEGCLYHGQRGGYNIGCHCDEPFGRLRVDSVTKQSLFKKDEIA